MPYIMMRDHWCHIIVLNIHAPTKDKTDYVKDSFYKELERVFDKFPKYPGENSVRRLQCQSRQGRHFETDNWELRFT
jgi:hypothetical protein